MSDNSYLDNPYLDTAGDVDASAIASAFWPLDGPHSRVTVIEAALMIDEMALYLARATAPWVDSAHVLPRAADLYRVVGELRSGFGRLGQVLDQLAARMDSLATDPTLYDDRGADRDPTEAAATAYGALRDSRARLSSLLDSLGQAHSATGHLGHRDTD